MGYIIMYHRGTLAEFNTWHENAKSLAGIPAEGVIGNLDGEPAPHNQRTTAYVNAWQNPDNPDDYVWPYEAYPDDIKESLSRDDFLALNWFARDM